MESDGFVNSKFSVEDVDFVIGVDFVVVGGVGEGERKYILFFEVGFVDMSERVGDDGEIIKVVGFESGVFMRRIFIVVLIIDNDLMDVFGFVVMGNSGDGILFISGEVFDFVGFIVGSVDGIN